MRRNGPVLESPGREPGRDRDSRLPDAPRSRARLGRGLLRRGPGCAAPAYADEAYALGGETSAESYLVAEKLLGGGLRAGAEAMHPGYGFLAENAGVRARGRGGGPRLDRAAAGRDRADGLEDACARRRCRRRACRSSRARPIRSASADEVVSPRRGDRLPAADQGGRRRRRQGDEGRLLGGRGRRPPSSRPSARGSRYFADASVYVEKYLEDPRHVEVQVLADAPRQRGAPRRARLHDAAPPPEADRGDAVARGRRRAARADRPRSPSTRRGRPATAPRARSRACSRRTAPTTSWR